MSNREKKNEKRYTGTFDSNARGFGFVRVEGLDRDLFVPQGKTCNAVYDDIVEVRVLRGDPEEGDNGCGRRAEAEVIRIVKHGISKIVGTYHTVGRLVFPDNPKIPFQVEILNGCDLHAQEGDKVVAKIRQFRKSGENPGGEITEVLGHITDPGVDILSIIRSYDLPVEFPEEVLQEAAELPDGITLENAGSQRKDYRSLPTVTIDGEDTRDIDDAISLEQISRKPLIWRLGVHIADVSEYVKEGSELDREALRRGTSIYLADRVIPMLPGKLSNGICSLNAGEDRLAMSCMMTIDSDGTVTDYEISESIIHVDARLSYNGVMRLFENNDDSEIAGSLSRQGYRGIKGRTLQIARMLRKMRKLASVLRNNRIRRGSIDFDFPEAKIEQLDESGKPVEIAVRERTEATDLIEDFMLLANETVARHLCYLEIPAIYRSHPGPAQEKMKDLSAFVRNYGYKLTAGGGEVHPKQIQSLLNRMHGRPEEEALSRMTLRSMQRALYTTTCDGHFGLALRYYCHFTSPIRRYPDLQVHRGLKYWLHGRMDTETIDRLNNLLPEVAVRCSTMERRAGEVENETLRQKMAEYMEDHVGETFDGTVSGVTARGLYVELPNLIEGMIRVSDLTDDFYSFDEKQFILVGEHTGQVHSLGEKIRIRVEGVDILRRTVDFVPDYQPESGPDIHSGAEVPARRKIRETKKGKLRRTRRQMDRTGRSVSGKARRTKRIRKRKGS